MIIIGLTGSIGMGKTTAANMLRDMKIPVHCSDEAVHKLLADGGAGVAPVAAAFPGAVDGQGRIDRARLRALLNQNHEAYDRLEAILHPLVRDSQEAFLRAQRQNGASLVVLDIPLLFETGADARVDYTLCVSAPDFIQRQRVMSRPGMTEAQFAFILSRQTPDAEKRRRADFVIDTGIGLAPTRQALQNALRDIETRGNKPPQKPSGP